MKPHLKYRDRQWWIYRNNACTGAPTAIKQTVEEAYQAHIKWLKYLGEIK